MFEQNVTCHLFGATSQTTPRVVPRLSHPRRLRGRRSRARPSYCIYPSLALFFPVLLSPPLSVARAPSCRHCERPSCSGPGSLVRFRRCITAGLAPNRFRFRIGFESRRRPKVLQNPRENTPRSNVGGICSAKSRLGSTNSGLVSVNLARLRPNLAWVRDLFLGIGSTTL